MAKLDFKQVVPYEWQASASHGTYSLTTNKPNPKQLNTYWTLRYTCKKTGSTRIIVGNVKQEDFAREAAELDNKQPNKEWRKRNGRV